MAYIPEQLRRQVAERAGHRCEYCQSNELFTGGPFHVEHVMPTARGGATELDNLAYACARCNLQKGLRIYTVDPVSRRSAPLFNPRQHRWSLHFHWSDDGTRVIGRTRTGRGTVVALKINHPLIVQARSLWVSCGIHPPDSTPKPQIPKT
jgi:hypothetical protein